MPGMSFRRRVGAVADVKEIEYIIALHQTCMPDTRENATVGSLDVYRLLQSRYGLADASHADIIQIVRELGGGDTVGKQEMQNKAGPSSSGKQTKKLPSPMKKLLTRDETAQNTEEVPAVAERPHDAINHEELEEYLDLVQILSLLLIPNFAMAAQEYRQGPRKKEVAPDEETGNPIRRLQNKFQTWLIDIKHERYESCKPDMELMAGDWRRFALRNLFGRDGNDTSVLETRSGDDPLPLNEELVRQILLKHGEIERAQDPSLIREMVQVAQSSSGMLDEEAWMNAVSSGLEDWGVNHFERTSTFFEDVFGTANPREVSRQDFQGLSTEGSGEPAEDEENAVNGETVDQYKFKNEQTTEIKPAFFTEWFNIDMVVDAHASLWAVAVIWLFFVLFAGVYGSLIVYLSTEDICVPAEEFGCQIVNSLVSWSVTGLLLSVCGLAVIMPMSFGNSPYKSSILHRVLSFVVTAVIAFVPFTVVKSYPEPRNEGVADLVNDPAHEKFQGVTLSVGILLLGMFVLIGLGSLLSASNEGLLLLHEFMSTSSAKAEARLKLSATRKTNSILGNAYQLHTNTRDQKGSDHLTRSSMSRSLKSDEHTMRNYVLKGERFEPCGGFLWTWSRILDGSLFSTEGVWINTRLIITQVAQVCVAVILSFFLFSSVEEIAQRAEDARNDLDPDTPQWAVDLLPTRRMVTVSLYPAALSAILVMILIMGVYVPSATSTVLKYRCQDLPSLGSHSFNLYRVAVDSAYMNLANGVWAMLGSAGLFYLLVGLVIFLFQWDFSQTFMVRLLGWGIGLTITIVLKMLLTMACRSQAYRAFFRIRPGTARVASLALECWYIGLGGSVLLGRITQFLLAAAFFVGRIDVLFLSDNVEVFGYAFDYVPLNFVKDLLVHESHRHPFLERLAQIYLMKLKHKSFCTRAGAAWRQLAVLALFPWMSRYRIFGEDRLAQALLSFSTHQEQINMDERGMVHIALEDTVENVQYAVEGAGTTFATAGREATALGREATALGRGATAKGIGLFVESEVHA